MDDFDYAGEAGRYTRFTADVALNGHFVPHILVAMENEQKEPEDIGDVIMRTYLNMPLCILSFGMGENAPPIPAGGNVASFNTNVWSHLKNYRGEAENAIGRNPAFPDNLQRFLGGLSIPWEYKGLGFLDVPVRTVENFLGLCGLMKPAPSPRFTSSVKENLQYRTEKFSPEDIYWEHAGLNVCGVGYDVYLALRREAASGGTRQKPYITGLRDASLALLCCENRINPAGITAPQPEEYDLMSPWIADDASVGKGSPPCAFSGRMFYYADTGESDSFLQSSDRALLERHFLDFVGGLDALYEKNLGIYLV